MTKLFIFINTRLYYETFKKFRLTDPLYGYCMVGSKLFTLKDFRIFYFINYFKVNQCTKDLNNSLYS